MSPDPVSWPIYILILLIVMVSNGLVSAALNALDSVDRNKLNEIEEDDPNNKREEDEFTVIVSNNSLAELEAFIGNEVFFIFNDSSVIVAC